MLIATTVPPFELLITSNFTRNGSDEAKAGPDESKANKNSIQNILLILSPNPEEPEPNRGSVVTGVLILTQRRKGAKTQGF